MNIGASNIPPSELRVSGSSDSRRPKLVSAACTPEADRAAGADSPDRPPNCERLTAHHCVPGSSHIAWHTHRMLSLLHRRQLITDVAAADRSSDSQCI